jgi:hypothetical protein
MISGLFPLAFDEIEDNLLAVKFVFFVNVIDKVLEFGFFFGGHDISFSS